MEECEKLRNLRREAYYIKVRNRQILKLNRLCHKNRGGHPNIQHGGHGRQEITDSNIPSTNTVTSDESKEVSQDMDKRWVVNLSSQQLTEAQTNLLTHGPNFTVTSKSPPTIECITAIEEICQKLEQGEVEELRGEVKAILKNTPLSRILPKRNRRPLHN